MSDWKEKKLGEIALINMGQSPDSRFYRTEEYGIPLIQGNADIKNRKSIKRIWTTQITKRCDEGDIIMTVRAPVGFIGKASFSSCIGRGVCSFKPIETNEKYLYHLLIFNENNWESFEQGSTFTAVGSKEVFNFPLTVTTSTLEQNSISSILDSIDIIIEKTQTSISKYKSIKHGMLHDLFTRGIDKNTGKLRPKYEDAPELYKESKLGWIPKEWDTLVLSEVINPIMSNVDKHIKDDEIKVSLCNYMDVYSNRYLTKDISFSEGSVNIQEMQRFSLKVQDVIITKDSETPDDIGVPTVLLHKINNLICGYHLCILRTKDLNLLMGEFLMFQLQISLVNKQFANKANGSTRYGLTLGAIESIYLKIPKNISEQNEISKRLRTIDNKLQSEQSYLHKMQKIKAGLMGDLLTGKKKVKIKELK